MATMATTLSLRDFEAILQDRNVLIDFLASHGVLRTRVVCKKCGNELLLNYEKLIFSCRKTGYITNAHKKRMKIQCNFYLSVRKDTWFGNSNLKIETACRFIAYFLLMKPPRQQFFKNELNLCDKTIVDWLNFCREVCIYFVEKNSQKLGGPGVIVEIDEAKIGHRKYNRGRIIEGNWIFRGIERDSKKCFLVPVPNRSQETLLDVIKKWILPGTTIISDCWTSYKCLENNNFQHLTVNHSLNFVNPETGAHTQNIERLWRDVRSSIPRYGARDYHMEGYIAEYIFKRIFPHKNRISNFFKLIAELHPPTIEEIGEPSKESSSQEIN
ncbi:uncharacterized protein LOC143188673 [Calliopsis andreniformis]|uniref:uncharacterized protein LOC143188673 n=1 Tax=Calliopsis andreniformis TaxID=337506 RepID=UPI003FCE8193